MRLLSEGWLRAYLEYTKNSEGPLLYHFWVGLFTLAAALGRHVWVDWGHVQLFPNLYLLLVGPSGRTRKTTSGTIGIKLLKKAAVTTVVQEKLSEAWLRGKMGELTAAFGEAVVTIFAPELKNTLGGKNESGDLINMLTSFYTSPDEGERHTRHYGEDEIRNICVNFLGCSTLDWLDESLPASSVEGGFTARFLMVMLLDTDRTIGWPLPVDKALEHKLVADIKHITTLRGPVRFTEQAQNDFLKWYEHRRSFEKDEPRLAGYYERKPALLLKVATLLAIADSDDLIVTEAILKNAHAALAVIEEEMPRALLSIGSEFARQQNAVLDLMAENGHEWVSREWLIGKLRRAMSMEQFYRVMAVLKEAGIVDSELDEAKRVRYRLVE